MEQADRVDRAAKLRFNLPLLAMPLGTTKFRATLLRVAYASRVIVL